MLEKERDLRAQIEASKIEASNAENVWSVARQAYVARTGHSPSYTQYHYQIDGKDVYVNGPIRGRLPISTESKFRADATSEERLYDEHLSADRVVGDLVHRLTCNQIECWGLTTANGIIYSSAGEASAVLLALEREGIAHHYPCTPEAHRALRKHGIERVPKIGEEWGCGCEFGVIEKFTEKSTAVIRQTKRDGLVAIGETTEIAIHVLSHQFRA